MQGGDEVMERKGDYLCEVCVALHEAPGMCPGCEEEPLIDVRDEAAMRLIRARDERRHTRRAAKFALLGMLIMTPIHLALTIFSFSVLVSFMFEHKVNMSLPWLLAAGFHLFFFGWSVLLVEERLMRRFPIRRAAAPVDGEEGERARLDWRDRMRLFWSLLQRWRMDG